MRYALGSVTGVKNMIEALYVSKSYGTYSDTCLMLGLACLAEYALGATGQKQGMQLIDEGTFYRIQFNKPMDLSKIESVSSRISHKLS